MSTTATSLHSSPRGYIASGDGYSRHFDEVIACIPRKTKCIDDTLMWLDTIEEAFFQAVEWLDVCGRNGITLNRSKFSFAKTTVEFAGFEITPTSVHPCPHNLEAIQNFPTPHNNTDIRSWFGLVNQVSYAFASTGYMQPFRHLLKPGTCFEWTKELEHLFEESKSVIIHLIRKGVEIFDNTKQPVLPLTGKSLCNRFGMVHVPGVHLVAADAVFHRPVGEPTSMILPDDIATILNPASSNLPELPHSFLAAIRTQKRDTAKICDVSTTPAAEMI
ncbi:hypothetical protein Pcinc_018034 [Petrolisthes cinctipes]|uniref:Uncharacterized protein n=1 Tax=Petrolisthes cinctipes TaxID=88211 RepID=A0AAE1FNV1_PETCI|nr:hypothetical protein Pcinc_018034 [Petrolisthes cinctipes]